MGTLTITPQFSDYGANTWASDPDHVAKQAVITQVCADLSAGLCSGPSVGNITCTIDYGTGVVGPVGIAVSSGAASQWTSATSITYSSFRTALLAMGAQNSIQTSGWNSTNLPSTAPNSEAAATQSVSSALHMCIGNMSQAFFNSVHGGIAGYVGIATGFGTNFDIHGIGGNSYYEPALHESS